MNIDSIGKKQIEKLYNEGLIQKISDLYQLRKKDLINLRGFEETSIEKLLSAIESSKKIKFEKVLFALGIRFVGETVAKTLVKKFKSIESLLNVSFEELKMVDEVGGKIAYSVVEYFNDEKNIKQIEILKQKGLQLKSEKKFFSSNVLEGCSIVVSGVFIQKSRAEIKNLIEENGGKNSSSISIKTSFIIAGDNMGPKKKILAEEIGIKLLTEDDFLAMIS
jgi:DNA ligase (NAD+)